MAMKAGPGVEKHGGGKSFGGDRHLLMQVKEGDRPTRDDEGSFDVSR